MGADPPASSRPELPLRVEPAEAEAFILTLAEALHAHGAAAHQLEGMLTVVADRLGIVARFYSTPTAVMVSFGPVIEGRTSLVRVHPGAINLEKISLLHDTTVSVIRGELGLEEGRARVAAIVGARRRYGGVISVIGFAVSSAASAVIFGGGEREVLASGVVGLAVGAIERGARRWSMGASIVEPIAAAVAAVGAAVAARALGPLSTLVVTLAGVVMLLPGLSVTTAMTELATRNLAAGTARVTGSLVQLLSLGFGVALGAGLVARLPPHAPLPPAPPPAEQPVASLAAAVLVAAVAASVLMQARPRDLGWILVVGGSGFAGARLGAHLLGAELGAFVGALLLGLMSNGVARAFDRPAAVPLVPGLILLVPGSIGFRGMFSLLENDVVSGVDTAFRAILVATALAAGLLFANIALPPRRAL
ncbi:threonine/serine exporter family protein [Sorangium sp. So ce1036]|uniref:threonine/serine ThrE exporter family protein n=1 Tax=Sorangium sp. So ce1036 TaxID=3133328 RepID=UPI003F12410E